jgi:3-oxoacyl-[acyl-carrier protein] reductase
MQMTNHQKRTAVAIGATAVAALFAARSWQRRGRYDFAGKSVVITGGSRGLGLIMARELAGEGAKLTLVARDEEELNRAVQDIGRRYPRADVAAVSADVRRRYDAERAVAQTIERHGRIDVLVNNAGVIRDNVLVGLEDDDIRTVLDVNVAGVFNVTRAIAPYMVARRAGKIVNLSSVSGVKGGRGQTNYAASKGAIDGLTRALAAELASRKITVNAVAPGVIETEMSEAVRDLAGDEIKGRILLRRFGQPREIANAVWFLASGLADYVTGQVLYVDGGFKME